MLGIRHVVVAVNKLDQLDFSASGLRHHRRRLPRDGRPPRPGRRDGDPGFGAARRQRRDRQRANALVPGAVAARVAGAGAKRIGRQRARARRRCVLQCSWCCAASIPDGGGARGYAGRIGSGIVVPGQRIRVLPSGAVAEVTSVSTFDGPLRAGPAGPVGSAAARPRAGHLPRRLVGGR